MRIDKLISDMGLASRKESALAAKKGLVLVDGVPVKRVDMHIDPEVQTVVFRGQAVNYRRYTYVMLNKPQGYVSATEDKSLPFVTELLSDELKRMDLFPVGRLDKDTTGLMILTNNGKLAHALLTPKRHVAKEYRFTSAEPMADGSEEYFLNGATLKDGYECKSAVLVCDSDRMGGIITLTEGKYHQIKRMVASTGNRVVALERISFAGIPLDSSLNPGDYRMLSEEEIEILTFLAK